MKSNAPLEPLPRVISNRPLQCRQRTCRRQQQYRHLVVAPACSPAPRHESHDARLAKQVEAGAIGDLDRGFGSRLRNAGHMPLNPVGMLTDEPLDAVDRCATRCIDARPSLVDAKTQCPARATPEQYRERQPIDRNDMMLGFSVTEFRSAPTHFQRSLVPDDNAATSFAT